jgi:predicted nucleotidyltransferase
LLQTLITSKTRLRLLLKFFLNSNTTSWLRDLEAEFGESTNGIRLELKHLEDAGMLTSEMTGNRKIYRANTKHPLFGDIHQLLLKYTGIDQIVDRVAEKLGGLSQVWLTGSFARGLDNPVIDILLVGEEIDTVYLLNLINKVEKIISRKIRFLIVSNNEKEIYMTKNPQALLIWENVQ